MSNEANNKKAPKLQKFAGAKSKIKISSWLSLFEVVASKMASTTDSDKSTLLMEYLEEDALQWFADDVAPTLATIKWSDVTEAIKNRFGDRTVDPVLAAQRRRLLKTENVQSYFDEKMYHLRKTGLRDPSMAEMLTDGMPGIYRTPLISASIKTTAEWLTIAVRLESSFSTYKPFNADNRTPHPISVNMADDSKRPFKKKSNKPSQPCRFCQKNGKTEYHWHADCPIRPPKKDSQQSESGPLAGVHEVVNTISKN